VVGDAEIRDILSSDGRLQEPTAVHSQQRRRRAARANRCRTSDAKLDQDQSVKVRARGEQWFIFTSSNRPDHNGEGGGAAPA
jgi:hypothetical protein